MKRFSIAIFCAITFISCSDAPKNNVTTEVTGNSIPDQTGNQDTATPVPISSTSRISCREAAMNILTSSRRYTQLTKGLEERVVKNGGDGFGIVLEGSPDTERDTSQAQSMTYDFSIHESYPDRAPVIARFTFDPAAKQLFEYNTAKDSLLPIEFDKSLLTIFENSCN